jgi:adenylate cyclase
MGVEIERKFLVSGDGWRAGVVRTRRIRQGYLARNDTATVRVRAVDDDFGALTVKGATAGIARAEFEYQIPLADAEQLLLLSMGNIIEKVRHDVQHGNLTWEVDVFHGANEGLVVAEVELECEDQAFSKPTWLGAEVTDDIRYYNAELVARPFNTWRAAEPHPAICDCS